MGNNRCIKKAKLLRFHSCTLHIPSAVLRSALSSSFRPLTRALRHCLLGYDSDDVSDVDDSDDDDGAIGIQCEINK